MKDHAKTKKMIKIFIISLRNLTGQMNLSQPRALPEAPGYWDLLGHGVTLANLGPRVSRVNLPTPGPEIEAKKESRD
jgi:hypothetical protein